MRRIYWFRGSLRYGSPSHLRTMIHDAVDRRVSAGDGEDDAVTIAMGVRAELFGAATAAPVRDGDYEVPWSTFRQVVADRLIAIRRGVA